MNINQDESKIVHFRNPSISHTRMVYTCGGKFLETVDKYMYLGLLLTQHLDYSLMAKQVTDSGNGALGLSISKCKSVGGLPFSTFTKLYDSTVASIIGYGASVWGCRKYRCISAVQNRALRFYLGVGRYTQNTAVSGDTGWDTVYQKQWKIIINQWCKIRRMDQNRLNFKVYQRSSSTNNTRYKNWARNVKHMFDEVGLGCVFAAHSDAISKRYIQNTVTAHL